MDQGGTEPVNYNEFHARRAGQFIDIRGTRVLVVGANTGLDCKYFVEWGAREVHGLDVVENVGADYTNSNVRYFCMSAESMQLPNKYYELVYCFATMEHVVDIEAAFKEMVRVTKPGGLVYSVASPLWNSRSGHHMSCLFPHPWIHLRMNKQEMVQHCKDNGIDGERGLPIESIVSYVFDSAEFNRRPARHYTEAIAGLSDVKIISHVLHTEPESAIPDDLRIELAQKNILADELRAVTHEFVAVKLPLTWKQRYQVRPAFIAYLASRAFRRIRRLFG